MKSFYYKGFASHLLMRKLPLIIGRFEVCST